MKTQRERETEMEVLDYLAKRGLEVGERGKCPEVITRMVDEIKSLWEKAEKELLAGVTEGYEEYLLPKYYYDCMSYAELIEDGDYQGAMEKLKDITNKYNIPDAERCELFEQLSK